MPRGRHRGKPCSPSGSSPGARSQAKDDWLCKSCVGKDGTPYRNFGSRMHCNACKVAKGSCFGKQAEPRAADIVAKRALEEKRALEQRHAQEVKRLKDELADARKASCPSTAEPASAAMALGIDTGASSGSEHLALDAAVARAKEKLKKLKELPSELRDHVAGGYDACCSKVQDELLAAQASRRAANPLKKRLEGAEAHKHRMAKKLADEKATLEKQEARLAELNKLVESQKAAILEAEASMAKASDEVASLAAQFASERILPAASRADAEQAPAGFVPIAFAEEKWAEREAAYAQQLTQLQALVAAAPSEPAPSEAEEEDSMDQIHDDEIWNKVEPSKRKALLGRQRDILAKKVKANLCKVSNHASPFKKS